MPTSWTYRLVRRTIQLCNRTVINHAIYEVRDQWIAANPVTLDTDEGPDGIREILAKTRAALEMPAVDFESFSELDS
jgi:hypothetical protein